MRNLLVMAIALSVVINEADAKHLGYDVTEEDFRQYFEIPADAVVDKEAMTSNFKKDENFSFDELKKFMNKKEQTLYKKTFPDAVEPAKSEDAPEVASAAKAEAKKKAEEEKAKAAADKKAKKEADAKAKADAKAAKEKERADAKAAKEKEKADKAAAKAAGAAAKKAIKPLSRSQQIMVYHSEGKDLAAIQELHPDWNASHIRNALFTAKNDADLVTATVQRKADYEAQEKAAAEAANQPAETVSADA